jgi:hypothetical protein
MVGHLIIMPGPITVAGGRDSMAALLVVKRGPNAATKRENILRDWDSLLHSIWIQKMVLNPNLYDDAKVNHATGNCYCRCTGNLHLREGHRKK